MGFLKLSLKNIARNRTRNLITLTSILIAVGVLFSVVSYDRGFSSSLEREMRRTGVHVTVVPTGCPHEAATLLLHGGVVPDRLDRETVAGIKDHVGDRAEGYYPMLLAQAHDPRRERLDLVYGMPGDRMADIKPQWRLAAGAFPEDDETIIIGSNVADRDDLAVGDSITYRTMAGVPADAGHGIPAAPESGMLEENLEGTSRNNNGDFLRTFEISGILRTTGTQDDDAVFVPLSVTRAILGDAEGITALGIRLEHPGAATRVIRDIERGFAGVQAVTADDLLETVAGVVQSARVLSFSMVILVAVVSGSGVLNSILMTVFERTREIGTMRSLGASRLDIFRLTMNEALVLTFIGGIAGILLATLGAPVIESFVRGFLPYVPEGRNIVFDPLIALGSLLFSMVIGVLAGLYPAWRASGITPIEAIRN